MKLRWLASYPKSGNTWLRIFLLHLQGKSVHLIGHNALEEIPNAANRCRIDSTIALNSTELTDNEIQRLRQDVYRYWGQDAKKPLMLKIHDRLFTDQRPVIPLDESEKIIYLIRNPLDVCVSFAHHSGKTEFDSAIEFMNDSYATVARTARDYHTNVAQVLGSWSEHVHSWTQWPCDNNQRLVIRYEDMVTATSETFTRIVNFLNINAEPGAIKEALRKCSFDSLQRYEARNGFEERNSQSSKPFFRCGKVGDWRNHLHQTQVDTLISHHKDIMRIFQYLDENDNLTIL